MANNTRFATTTFATIALLLVSLGTPALIATHLTQDTATAQFQSTTNIALAAITVSGTVIWISLMTAMLAKNRPLRHTPFLPASWQQFFRQWIENSAFGLGAMSGWTMRNPELNLCLLYTSPSPRDRTRSRMPSSA